MCGQYIKVPVFPEPEDRNRNFSWTGTGTGTGSSGPKMTGTSGFGTGTGSSGASLGERKMRAVYHPPLNMCYAIDGGADKIDVRVWVRLICGQEFAVSVLPRKF